MRRVQASSPDPCIHQKGIPKTHLLGSSERAVQALAAENAMATAQPGTELHLRLQASVSGGTWYLDNQYVILERADDLNFTVNKTEVTSGFWDDLDHAADSTISSSVLTGTTVLQTYIETNPGNPGNQSNVAANGFAEWDFAITAPATAGYYYYHFKTPDVTDSVSATAMLKVEEALPPQGAAVFWVNDCTSVSCTPVNPGNVVGVNDGSNSSCDTKNVSDSWTLTFEDSVGMSDTLNPIDNMTITMYYFNVTLDGIDDYAAFQIWDFNAGAYAIAISVAEGDDYDYGAQTTKTMIDSGDILRCNTPIRGARWIYSTAI
ncbi:MAG: hypothetical protein E3J72_22540 [Planctomycetota bacterium]|nr:MAG: hypothetical protein E3J72_22540 [Planctomycetota bacterium]